MKNPDQSNYSKLNTASPSDNAGKLEGNGNPVLFRLEQCGSRWVRFMVFALPCLLLTTLFGVVSASAAQLTWDAGNTNDAGTIESASGNWDPGTTNFNWNTGTGNIVWPQTSATAPTTGAIFGGPDAAAGTYQITIDGPVAYTNLTINANGYYFNGPSTMYQSSPGSLFVADGKSVTFSNNMVGNNATMIWQLGTSGAASSLTYL